MSITLQRGPCQGPPKSSDGAVFDRDRFRRRLRLALDNSGDKQEVCAMQMGVDTSLISHWARGARELPAWRLPAWTQTYGADLLSYTAARCGFALVPADAVRFTAGDFKTLVALFFAHCADFAAAALRGDTDAHLAGMRWKAARIAAAIEAADEWGAA